MAKSDLDRALRELERGGLLLLHDARLPSLSTLVAGEPVRGSWWSHPSSRAIFRTATELEEHADVLVVKLIAGKVTFVHRSLWPALLAVATARESWQVRGLRSSNLLERVQTEGVVRCRTSAESSRARDLSARLLVRAAEVHDTSGKHVLELEDWIHWSRRVRCRAGKSVARAKAELERAAAALGPTAVLPWSGVGG